MSRPFADVPDEYRLATTRDVHDRRVLLLDCLREHNGFHDDSGLAMTPLAEALGVHRKMAQIDTNALAEEGYVELGRNVRRTHKIDITDKGREAVRVLLGEPEPEPVTVINVTDEAMAEQPESASITEPDEESGPTAEEVADALLAKVLARASGADVAVNHLRRELAVREQQLKELARKQQELTGELSEARSIERGLRQQLGRANERVGELNGIVEALQRHQRGGTRLKPDDRAKLEEFRRTMEERPRG